jgi:hypothetical protein
MFAQAYMGRERIFQMLSLHFARILPLGSGLFALITVALERASPHLFGPWSRISCTDACAAFIKESRMKFVNAGELNRKSGCTLGRTWGTRPEPKTLVGRLKSRLRRAGNNFLFFLQVP